jgi:hypothetical protein
MLELRELAQSAREPVLRPLVREAEAWRASSELRVPALQWVAMSRLARWAVGHSR